MTKRMIAGLFFAILLPLLATALVAPECWQGDARVMRAWAAVKQSPNSAGIAVKKVWRTCRRTTREQLDRLLTATEGADRVEPVSPMKQYRLNLGAARSYWKISALLVVLLIARLHYARRRRRSRKTWFDRAAVREVISTDRAIIGRT